MAQEVKLDFVTGNFKLGISGTVNDQSVAKFVKAGTIYVVQRDGATKTYLEVAGVKNDKGKSKLPDGFERDSVEFSDDTAAKMVAGMKGALAPYGDFEVTAERHVKGAEQAPMKRATDFVQALLTNGEDEAKLRALVSAFGAEGNEDEAELIKLVHDNVPGFKGKPKATAAE